MPTWSDDAVAGDGDGGSGDAADAHDPPDWPDDRPVRPELGYAGSRTDAELVEAVRRGDTEAYSRLYQRHVRAAYNMARQVSRSAPEADDLVSEAFAKVLDSLRTGRGPDSAFRAYLLTTLRHTAYDKSKADRRIELTGDLSAVHGDAVSVPFADPALAGLERSLAAQAFHRLPERWQEVLWQTEIEEQSPAEVAPLLGLSPNGVSALAYRAREGLRQAYLQVHLSGVEERSCRATVDRLGAWTRSGLSKRQATHVEHHLHGCASCRRLAEELVDVNTALRGVLPACLLGTDPRGCTAPAPAMPRPATQARQPVVGMATVAAAVVAALTVGVGAQSVPSTPYAADRPVPGEAAQRPKKPAAGSPAPPTRAAPVVAHAGDLRLRRGTPARFDVTVGNSGTGPSGPVRAELRLRPGVRALPADEPATSDDTVRCPGGTATVRCGTVRGVRPGESATLRFVLQAERQPAGPVHGTVRDGSSATTYVAELTIAGEPAGRDPVAREAGTGRDATDG